MAKYILPQFGTLEIEPTTIEIKFETLAAYPSRNTFDVNVALITEKVNYIHEFKELPYVGVLTNSEVEQVVNAQLKDFIKNV
jgi:hypothetical protein